MSCRLPMVWDTLVHAMQQQVKPDLLLVNEVLKFHSEEFFHSGEYGNRLSHA